MTLKEKFQTYLNEEKKISFLSYYNLLCEWNEKFNLTSITDKEQVYLKHFADSIAAIELLSGEVLDIGAGAGFPSVPLKIVKPSLKITMLDSLNKRVNFLNEVIKKLELEDISAVHLRAEEFKKREGFDFVIARAVAPLNTLAEYMLPFVKIGGKAIAYKSEDIESEIKSAEKAVGVLGGKISEIKEFTLDGEINRKLVVMEKIKETPLKYPRSGNKPRLSPL